jgi:hypothetical protein
LTVAPVPYGTLDEVSPPAEVARLDAAAETGVPTTTDVLERAGVWITGVVSSPADVAKVDGVATTELVSSPADVAKVDGVAMTELVSSPADGVAMAEVVSPPADLVVLHGEVRAELGPPATDVPPGMLTVGVGRATEMDGVTTPAEVLDSIGAVEWTLADSVSTDAESVDCPAEVALDDSATGAVLST